MGQQYKLQAHLLFKPSQQVRTRKLICKHGGCVLRRKNVTNTVWFCRHVTIFFTWCDLTWLKWWWMIVMSREWPRLIYYFKLLVHRKNKKMLKNKKILQSKLKLRINVGKIVNVTWHITWHDVITRPFCATCRDISFFIEENHVIWSTHVS